VCTVTVCDPINPVVNPISRLLYSPHTRHNILDITGQQLERIFNEVVNQTNRCITKDWGYVEVYKFQIYCVKDLKNCVSIRLLQFASIMCGSKVLNVKLAQ
jgi:hypothetical protein